MRFRMRADLRAMTLCWCLMVTALMAQTNTQTRPDPDKTVAVDMTAAATNRVDKPSLPFATDTQVRLMGLFEPTETNSPINSVASETNQAPYLAIEGVPL